jgi:hypothetical protein
MADTTQPISFVFESSWLSRGVDVDIMPRPSGTQVDITGPGRNVMDRILNTNKQLNEKTDRPNDLSYSFEAVKIKGQVEPANRTSVNVNDPSKQIIISTSNKRDWIDIKGTSPGVTHVSIDTKDGSDIVLVKNSEAKSVKDVTPGSLMVDTGAGDDLIIANGSGDKAGLLINTGEGSDIVRLNLNNIKYPIVNMGNASSDAKPDTIHFSGEGELNLQSDSADNRAVSLLFDREVDGKSKHYEIQAPQFEGSVTLDLNDKVLDAAIKTGSMKVQGVSMEKSNFQNFDLSVREYKPE